MASSSLGVTDGSSSNETSSTSSVFFSEAVALERVQSILGHTFQHQSILFCALTGIPGQIEHRNERMVKIRPESSARKGDEILRLAIRMNRGNAGVGYEPWDQYSERICGTTAVAEVARRTGLDKCFITIPERVDDNTLAEVLRTLVHAVCIDVDNTDFVELETADRLARRLGFY